MLAFINKRNAIFTLLTVLAGWMAYSPLRDLLTSTTKSEYYSHILLIPLVSGYFIYTGRKAIFAALKYSYAIGFVLLILGAAFYAFGWHQGNKLNQNDYSALMTFSALIFWMGSFILFFGTRAFRVAIFPLFFLAFMIPVPSVLMDNIIYVLQVGSAEVVYLLFGLTELPVAREGFVFQLPGLNIEVAKQCSGIRSSLGLFITGILASHYFLKNGWNKILLILAVFPITIFKNGIRVVTLTLLAMYVDERILTQGFLHKSGGFIFYIPALILLGLILWFLRKSERKK